MRAILDESTLMAANQSTPTKAANELAVFWIVNDSACSECHAELLKGRFLTLEHDKPLCLKCADLDHLVYLPRGDAALTRRSKKYSRLTAVVLRFSRARGRYERQGLLVEEAALQKAEHECLSDEAQREAARERAAVVRERADQQYVSEFAAALRACYPGCPADAAGGIAAHACEKYSGRVGRSAMAKALDAEAIDLAVRAHVRHEHTEYDTLLSRGTERAAARAAVAHAMEDVLRRWKMT
jgi:hypothetical protein